MSFDIDLQEIVKIAFVANPSNTEYYFRKYIRTLRNSLFFVREEMTRLDSEMKSIAFDNNKLLSKEYDHLSNTEDDLERTIYKLELLISSLNCKL